MKIYNRFVSWIMPLKEIKEWQHAVEEKVAQECKELWDLREIVYDCQRRISILDKENYILNQKLLKKTLPESQP